MGNNAAYSHESTYDVELPREEGRSAVLRLVRIGRVTLKELTFSIQRSSDSLVRLNVPLATVDHRNVSETKRDDTAGKNVNNISTSIPE